MASNNNFCKFQESDFSQDKDIKAILSKGISQETIISACLLVKEKENSQILKLMSEIELGYFRDNEQITDIKAATELICNRYNNMLLECIDKLNGVPVMLKVSGAFSALLSVTGSNFLLRQLKKSESEILTAIDIINSNTAEYIEKAVVGSPKIISFADPSAMQEVIGEENVRKFSIEPTYLLMKTVAPYLSQSIMHICPRTSFALEKSKLCAFEKYTCSNENLINNLLSLCEIKEICFSGHVCINSEKCQNNEIYIHRVIS